MTELKPCKCGGKVRVEYAGGEYFISCENGCKDIPSCFHSSEKATAEEWNNSKLVSEVDDREVEALKNKCERLNADNRKMKSEVEELTEKLKWFESTNRELEHSNHVLSAQMEVVRMFLRKGDMDE